MKASKLRFGVETAVSVCAGVLGIVTVFWRDWIEAMTGWDPDHHNGSAEWLIVVGLLVVAVISGALARRDWKLLTAVSVGSAA
jgi:undecaprenyl pyrophosphate phosphatase UppP